MKCYKLQVAKKKKGRMALLMNDDDEMMEQQRQHLNESNDGPSNFINYRRRLAFFFLKK